MAKKWDKTVGSFRIDPTFVGLDSCDKVQVDIYEMDDKNKVIWAGHTVHIFTNEFDERGRPIMETHRAKPKKFKGIYANESYGFNYKAQFTPKTISNLFIPLERVRFYGEQKADSFTFKTDDWNVVASTSDLGGNKTRHWSDFKTKPIQPPTKKSKKNHDGPEL